MGAGLILAAGILWWRSRSFRDRPREPATYRTVGSPGSHVRSNLRALAGLLVAIFALTQLPYVGVYIELVQWLLGGRAAPRISGDLFFWVLLVSGMCAGGAVYSGSRSLDDLVQGCGQALVSASVVTRLISSSEPSA